MRRFVIIGDGAAGTAAVELLRQEDPHAAITLLSADPNPCYYRAALTNYLMGQLRDGEIWAVPPDFYDRHRIDRQFCRAAQIDTTHRMVIGDDGRRFPYDALLIGTGSRARHVEVPGSQLAGAGVFRTLQDVNLILHELPQIKQAVISGGGILGLEWVHGLRERGVHPIFMMRQHRFWPQLLDLAASDIVLSRLERAGIELALGEEVAEVLSRDGQRVGGVRTKSGKEIACQLYGMAFGIVPNIEFLEGSGIDHSGRGVRVNVHMETNIPNVYAAGDVVDYQDPSLPFMNPTGLWMPSRQQAQVAARNMLGLRDSYQPGALYNATRLWDLDLGSLGITVPEEGQGFEEVVYFPREANPPVYKKVVLKEGKVYGALLLGNRREGKALKRIIDKKLDVSSIKEHLFDEQFDLRGWIRQHEGQGVEQRQFATATVVASVVGASGLTQMVARARTVVGTAPVAVVSTMSGMVKAGASHEASLVIDGVPYPLRAGISAIGRAPDNQVIIAQPSISAHHASITLQGETYFIADLRSTNGTFVNEQPLIEPCALADSDEVRFGDVVARFRGPAAMQIAALSSEGASSGWLLSSKHSYPLQASIVRIGRAVENEISFPQDTQLSRLHAQISRQTAGGTLYLLDMGSANGTFVNGQHMTTPRRLAEGDEIRVGQSVLRFVTTLPADAPPPYDPLQAQRGNAPFLAVRLGPNRGQRVPLQGSLRLGRAPDCDIVLADPRVSHYHAEVIWHENKALVRDLGSTNGTWLGTARLWGQQAVPLPPDAELRLGESTLRLEFGGQAAQAVLPAAPEGVGGKTIVAQKIGALEVKPLWLTFRNAGDQLPVPLGVEPITLGRDPSSCTVVLTDTAASRQHARIERRPDGIYVSDLGSANGTFVNDVRIGSTMIPLRPRDVMRIGQTTIRVTDIPPVGAVGVGLAPTPTPTPSGTPNLAQTPTPDPRPLFWLTVAGTTTLDPVPVGKTPLLIGREPTCAVILTDDQASREHARIELREGEVFVRDLQSANGSFLNEMRLGTEAKALQVGDVLRIGNTFLTLTRSPEQVEPLEGAEPIRPVYRLLFIEQGERAPVVVGPSPIVLGRDPSCTVPLADPQASRQHARIENQEGQILLTDLGSANGTFVNSIRLSANQPYPLKEGDELRLAQSRFGLEAAEVVGPEPVEAVALEPEAEPEAEPSLVAETDPELEPEPSLVTKTDPALEPEPEPEAEPEPSLVAEPEPDIEAPLFWLLFGEGSDQPPVPLGKSPLLLGRLPECDIVLEDRMASRRHTRIEQRGNEVYVQDLNSANGTFLNETRLGAEAQRVSVGDVIRIGSTLLHLRDTAPAPVEREAMRLERVPPPTYHLRFSTESGLAPIAVTETPLLLGRDPICAVVLKDTKVSRQHLQVRLDAGQVLIMDLGSSNGSFLNAERLEPQRPYPLTPQDSLRLGDIVIQLSREVEGA